MKFHNTRSSIESTALWKNDPASQIMTCYLPIESSNNTSVPHNLIKSNSFINNKMKVSQELPIQKYSKPRILFVCRRSLRKNKYINYIGEQHLNLIQRFGGIPILIPRTDFTLEDLSCYLPMDGLIIAEGEDLGRDYNPYGKEPCYESSLLDYINQKHPSDAFSDHNKDSLEWMLLDICLEKNVPFLGLCRGSQIMNVKCGGNLYQDIYYEIDDPCQHINYENYDNHRHSISVLINTPMGKWFEDEVKKNQTNSLNQLTISSDTVSSDLFTLMVNSYHHQGIRSLSPRFSPMAFSPDGLIEAFYDPKLFDPENGKYCAAFQFHPERMIEDYSGCQKIYKDFIEAARKFRSKNQF